MASHKYPIELLDAPPPYHTLCQPSYLPPYSPIAENAVNPSAPTLYQITLEEVHSPPSYDNNQEWRNQSHRGCCHTPEWNGQTEESCGSVIGPGEWQNGRGHMDDIGLRRIDGSPNDNIYLSDASCEAHDLWYSTSEHGDTPSSYPDTHGNALVDDDVELIRVDDENNDDVIAPVLPSLAQIASFLYDLASPPSRNLLQREPCISGSSSLLAEVEMPNMVSDEPPQPQKRKRTKTPASNAGLACAACVLFCPLGIFAIAFAVRSELQSSKCDFMEARHSGYVALTLALLSLFMVLPMLGLMLAFATGVL